jgi:hypothetical protein
VRRLPAEVAKPVIDGVLDDPAWEQASALEVFGPLASFTQANFAETRAWVTYDDEKLYVAFRCAEPTPNQMKIVGEKHDDEVWQGDDVEVMISAPGKTAPFYHFMVNPKSVAWDSVNSGEADDRKYDPKWQWSAKVGQDFWAAEMAIPWAEMNMPSPKPGEKLRANLCRQRTPVHELTAWSPMASGFLEHELFGTWVFK